MVSIPVASVARLYNCLYKEYLICDRIDLVIPPLIPLINPSLKKKKKLINFVLIKNICNTDLKIKIFDYC